MAFECREPAILRCFGALLGGLRAVFGGELSIPRRFGHDLPHPLPRVADHFRHQLDRHQIPCISRPVALIGHLIASEGGDIPIVGRRIARGRDLRAFL